MSNSFDLSVYYQNQKHSFHIGTDLQTLDDVRNSICDLFNIDLNDFIIEAYDETYNLFIALDQCYFEELRVDSCLTKDKNILARIRSHKYSAFNMVNDDDQISKERCVEPNDLLANHVVIWLDHHIGQSGNCNSLKIRLDTMIEPYKQGFLKLNDDIPIDSLIVNNNQTSYTSQVYPNGKLFAFSNISEFIEFLYKISNNEHAIFIIIDDISSRTVLPQIFDNIYIHKIYIFLSCFHLSYDFVNEIIDYSSKVNVFEHELDLFSRLARDIAKYYSHKASKDRYDVHSRLLLFNWIQNFYEIADENEGRTFPLTDHISTKKQILELEKLSEDVYD